VSRGRGNAFAFRDAGLDRASERRADAAALDADRAAPGSRFLLLRNDGRILLGSDGGLALAAPGDLPADPAQATFLGLRGDRAWFSSVLADESAAAEAARRGGRFADLRGAASSLPAPDAGLVAYARALAHWQSRKRWCGVCGSPTRLGEGGHRAQCSDAACGATYFPRTDPAIIVIVASGTQCLLGRQASWPPGRYSTLAGFVEPGETLEQAVAREVAEESGVRIAACRYVGSQPWPFPASLMLGFEARARMQAPRTGSELEDARWFDAARMPALIASGELALPPALSISFHLIDRWFHRRTGGRLEPGQPLASR
jgi:NAD+ diphosphatase